MDDFPPEMKRPMTALHTSLTELKECLTQFTDQYPNLKNRALSPLLKAKIELTKAYAINSLFWIYLTTKGVDPREHAIKGEISRLKVYMERIQEIEDKQKAAKLDTKAANRFIRSALWEPSADDNTESQNNKRKFKEDPEVSHKTSTNKANHKTHKKFKNK